MPNPVAPFRWEGANPIDLGAQVSKQTLWGLRVSFGANLPTAFTMAVESALPMALTESYTGLAKDVARLIAGPVEATTSGQSLAPLAQTSLRERFTRELGLATSDTRSRLNVMALLTAARANRAATAAPPRAASPAPASTPRAGGGGGPSGGYATYPSS